MTEAEARAWVATHVSRETLAKFATYAQLIAKWQRAINLVSPTTIDQIFARHIADSLQVFTVRPTNQGLWLDIGSGAGFPGLVCAVAAQDVAPQLVFRLIESDKRKAGFLREAARQLSVSVDVLTTRIEETNPQYAQIISARALAPLSKLCELSAPHLEPDGTALFQKGRSHEKEQRAADQVWMMTREILPSKTEPDAVIYRIGNLRRV